MPAMMRKYFVVAFLVIVAIELHGNKPCFAQTSKAVERLRAGIGRELDSPLFRRVLAAVEVSDVASGAILFERNSGLLLRPASNAKLITSAAALLRLSGASPFRTRVYARRYADSTDVWIRGCGDPLLSDDDVATIAGIIARGAPAPLRALHLDAEMFDSVRYGHGWMWDDATDASTPCLSAFPFHRNTIRFTAGPGSNDDGSAIVRLDPAPPDAAVTGRIRPGRQTGVTVRRAERGNDFVVSGTLRPGGSHAESFGMWRPDLVFGGLLLAELDRRGVRIGPAPSHDGTPEEAMEIGGVEHALDTVLAVMNKESDNACAEHLLKRLGALISPVGASSDDGIAVVRATLAGRGVDTADIRLVDGSGISYYNLVSARALGAMLRMMARSDVADRYMRSLAVGGRDGTLAHRFAGLENDESVLAKTGTLRSVSALSGYVKIQGGRTCAFVILMQNVPGDLGAYTRAQERILRHCLRFLREEGINRSR